MENSLTKENLRQFSIKILNDITTLIDKQTKLIANNEIHIEWLRSKSVKKLLDISYGTLQNLRITGKIRHKKIMGSYYYNKSDLLKLFE
ncbi:helix-turn-helix domain-containing protein [Elizabethkingia sp. 2-6]|uniref:helix-turn-helix domain-containing protein n=1 Tax=Elizabethkingia sp. 2-6 TaxID=2575699 RepID=UPI0010C1A3EE|nr:helix-turn-helix domain-containing protein [Elizabethkingia sp. 2-6]QCO45932.1 helix-turn-helix domain-containing protein [Elizabethkingia sp. 2-6]